MSLADLGRQSKEKSSTAAPSAQAADPTASSTPSAAPSATQQGATGSAAVPATQSLKDYLDSQSLTDANDKGQVTVAPSLKDAERGKTDDPYVVISDGSSHVRFERDLTKQQGADVTTTIDGHVYGATFTDTVDLLAYDVDSAPTTSLQDAIAVAAERRIGLRLSPTQTYTLSEELLIPDEVPFLDGNGATLDVSINGGTQSQPSIALRLATGSSGTTVQNLTIDLTGCAHSVGLHADAVSDSTITGLSVTGVTFRGIQLTAVNGPLSDISVVNNKIDSVEGTKDNKGVVYPLIVTSALKDPDTRFADSGSPIWERYVTDGTVSPNRYETSNLLISGNTITGGYYGIGLSGVSDSAIRANTVTANVRNISMQNNCTGNTVEGNSLTNSHSSAVHLAYNSDRNTVRSNTVSSDRATGQALLQAYQGSDSNVFDSNTVTLTGSSAPAWALYSGPDSSGTTFTNNTVSGYVKKAFVGVESVWDSTSAQHSPASYMGGGSIPSPIDGSAVSYNGGRGPLDSVTVTGNTLTSTNRSVPVFYVGAEVSAGRSGHETIIGNVTNIDLRNNTVSGPEDPSKTVMTHAGSVSGVGTATITGSLGQ